MTVKELIKALRAQQKQGRGDWKVITEGCDCTGVAGGIVEATGSKNTLIITRDQDAEN